MAIARRLMTAAVIYKKEMITKDNTCLVNWCDESRQFRVLHLLLFVAYAPQNNAKCMSSDEMVHSKRDNHLIGRI